ncbi:pyruvate oxidase [Listeria monocytogenes]|uniref:pyruvate oxidase n=1 Tax=Listeria monocytogenes TaxID=1639 RepID=UPI00085C3C26|nr:pyruvate oxidase [Listeria monocytogenes]EAG9261329.1 pyruvate oxidase [Listeria monocytogenes]EAG9492190.1 pyruvate oxidase [Listeria monocytogenes]OEP23590.1 pyruvate oxidase [Listeria monocytogenes]OET11199.1 pyruvate oxidase [Listeria monocytogenes]PCW74747.1 pyruvate oxidase [Listeria monocytogenes]
MKKVKASETLVQTLKNWGIDHVYGLPGDSIDTVVDALRKEQEAIEFIHVRHEEVATLAAAAYTKLTGKIGVALSIGGPGAIHLLNGMYDAKMDHVPMLVLAGQVTTDVLNTGFFQEVNLPAIFEDVAVYNKQIDNAETLADVVDEAIRTAYKEKGVAVLTIPNDIPSQVIKANLEAKPVKFEQENPKLDEAAIHEAVTLLEKAEKPVILAGLGTKHAGPELMAFSEKLKIPIIHSLPAKTIVPDNHPNALGNLGKIGTKPAYEAMQETDLLLMFGNDYPYSDYLPKKANCIQIDIDPAKISKRFPATVGLVGDAAETIGNLTAKTAPVEARKFLQACQENMQEWWKWLEEDIAQTTDPIAPEVVMANIQKIADKDAIFSIDVGTATVWSTRYLHLSPENDFIVSAWLGTMGCGLPGAIAAKKAFPDRQAIAIVGDGGFSMVMQDFVTAVGLNMPMIVVVLNNQQLSFIKYEQQSAGELNYAIDLPDINYAKFAESCGGIGFRVEKIADLEAAFENAKLATKPVIIDVSVDNAAAPLPGKIVMDEALGYTKFEIQSVLEDHRFAKMPPLKTILRRFL